MVEQFLKGLGIRLLLALGILLRESSSPAQTVVWSGAGTNAANTNWSASLNWTGGTPAPTNNILFFDPGAVPAVSNINNIVDGNTAVLSLQYGNTNGYHTTLINPGVTLMVSNNASSNLMVVGTLTDNGAGQIVDATVTGRTGTLLVVSTNTGSVMQVQQGSASSGSHAANLDLSGLGTFRLTAGRLLVAANAGSSIGASNWLSATWYLASTNLIRVNGPAPAFDVGDAINNGGASYVYLGLTNAIFADSVTVAHSKASVTMSFNPALAGSNAVVTLAGNTNARVTTLSVADFSAQSSSASTTAGTLNLSGGSINAQVSTCFVSEGQSGNGTGPSTGVLTIGPGLFNVNTLNVGYANSSSASGTVAGTVNVTNGTLVINNALLLAFNAGATSSISGTLNITNGTVLANTVSAGGGTAKIQMTGGFLAVSNTLATPGAPLGTLTLNKGATLQLAITNNLTNAAVRSLVGDNSGMIDVASLPTVLAYPSVYPLIYSPSGGASGVTFAVGSLPGTYQGFISNDNSSLVWLVVTNGPPPPKTDLWTGGINSNWDTNTLNWTNNHQAVAYSEGDQVFFYDSAQTANVSIVGGAAHTPYVWVISNNVVDYSFTGTNSVGGSASLSKYGAAAATLSESGDSFGGGITVNGGTLILNEATSAIGGGLIISNGAVAQIGNHNASGTLPAGNIVDNGSLVFSHTGTDLVAVSISGSGSLIQQGPGMVQLSGANTFSGNLLVLGGTLALTNSGALASPDIIVSNATLDVSGVSGAPNLNDLNLTNATLTVGTATMQVSSLNLGGASNRVNVVSLPPNYYVYPTNITLAQAATAITGNNLVLGSLPAASPAYAGSLTQTPTAIMLTLTSGPVALVQATVTFSSTNSGLPLNPAFCGLSYEKNELTGNLFVSTDTSLINMFAQIAPAVLRVGGNSVDTTCWGGLSNLTAITASDVAAFAGFVKALPTNWHVIYGINMSVNNPTNCAAEAAYVASQLGSSLLGFEIGNEPDLYHGNGIRSSSFTFSDFLAQWQALAGGITNTVPGWAITNGGNGWTLTGPASASNTEGYSVPFAGDEAGVNSLLTQHYYRANGQSSNSTIQLLLTPDPNLPGEVSTLSGAASAANLPLGFRMDECGSFYNGGAPNVSDAYGTALWTIDYMFTLALNGAQGMNFHGGGDGTGYTPIADNGAEVVQARPEFYGLKLFSLVSQGSVIPATYTLSSNINFTAYGVRRTNGAVSAVLNNKDTNNAVQVTINLGAGVTAAQAIELAGPSLNSTNNYTLGGAVIEPDGSWAGGVQWVTPATNGQLTLLVPSIHAILLNPIVTEGSNYLLANDALNTSSFVSGTNWSDGQLPHTGANYFTATNLLRTPGSPASVTFGGDSLALGPSALANTSLRLKFNSPGGTCVLNNFTNAGGIIDAGTVASTNFLSGSNWVIVAPSGFGLSGDNTRALVLTNLNLSGGATLSNGVANGSGYNGVVPTNGLGTVVFAGSATNFTGPIVTSFGTTLEAYSQTNLGGNPASFSAAQFVLDNGVFLPLASLSLSNANSGVMLNPGGGTFNVNPGLTLTVANPIAGSGTLTLTGGGLLGLSATNTYGGATAINAGTLALRGRGSLQGTPKIIVAGGAVFDVSALASPFSLATGQILSNSSPGAVISGTNNTGVGVLALTYNGTNPALLVTNGGMNLSSNTAINVFNTGSPLALGGSYEIIAKAGGASQGLVAGALPATVNVTGNGAAGLVTPQILGGQLYLNVLYPDLSYSNSANQLHLSWPTNYLGWLLQSNAVSVTQSNEWFTVPGSAATNSLQIPISPTQPKVFYRLAPP